MSHDSPGRWNKEISLYIVASVRRQLFLDTQFLLLQTCKECRIRQRSALFRLDTFIQASMLGLKSCNMAVLHIYSPSRSEEHTSELQSLMRISYAVFCLKKQSQQKITTYLHSSQHNRH